MGCRILTPAILRRVVDENMPFLELEKDSGIYELYADGRMSIGVSYEDIEKYKGEWLRDVYIFNLFVDGEYVNIEGEFVRDKHGNMVDAAGLGTDGFHVVADAWNKAVLELGVFSLWDGLESVRQLLNKGFAVRWDLGFEHGGQWIQNPFYDETLRFEVNPVAYYGEEKVRAFVSELLLEAICPDRATGAMNKDVDTVLRNAMGVQRRGKDSICESQQNDKDKTEDAFGLD